MVRGWSFCTHPFCTHPACSSLNSSEGHPFLNFPSWKSPFPEFSSTCMPPKVTFPEISAHSLLFSQIYLANCLRHMKIVFLQVVFLQVVCLLLSFCRMSACVLLILSSLTGHFGLSGHRFFSSFFLHICRIDLGCLRQ